jgi:hypothetical protein
MPEDPELQEEQIEGIRQERELLLQLIAESQELTRRSQEQVGRLDELLAEGRSRVRRRRRELPDRVSVGTGVTVQRR